MFSRPGSVLALAFATLGLAALPAAAQDWKYDGRELARFAADYEKLRDSNGSTDDPSLAARVAYFTGFVMGVARANADRGWYCMPEDVMTGQAWDVVARFLREYPSLLEAKPSTIVNGALAKGFPCTESERAAARKEETKPASKPKANSKPGS